MSRAVQPCPGRVVIQVVMSKTDDDVTAAAYAVAVARMMDEEEQARAALARARAATDAALLRARANHVPYRMMAQFVVPASAEPGVTNVLRRREATRLRQRARAARSGRRRVRRDHAERPRHGGAARRAGPTSPEEVGDDEAEDRDRD